MTNLCRVSALAGTLLNLALFGGAQSPPPNCKAVVRYGVKGCEILPDGTCPPGYHKEAVSPPDPRMKAPTFLMCVPDKPESKEQKPQSPPQENHPPR